MPANRSLPLPAHRRVREADGRDPHQRLRPIRRLFGHDDADEPNEGVAVGEDPDRVGAASDFLVSGARRGCWVRSGSTRLWGTR